jgi:hypothetical protein
MVYADFPEECFLLELSVFVGNVNIYCPTKHTKIFLDTNCL